MYKTLKWTQFKSDFDILEMPSVKDRFKRAIQHNSNLYVQKLDAHSRLIELAKEVYGNGSKQVKYLNRHSPEQPPNLDAELRKLERRYKKYCEEEERKGEQRIKAQQYRERRDAANAKLEALGYEPYEDFKPSRAITFLKKIEEETHTHQLEAQKQQAIPYTDLPEGTFARVRVISQKTYHDLSDDVIENGLLNLTDFDTMGVIFNDYNKPCFPFHHDGETTFGEQISHNGLTPIAIEEILETP